MLAITATTIPGCFEIKPTLFDDERGRFVKVFHEEIFSSHGLETKFTEEYYSHSKRGVIRGMHFQLPPSDHVKMVYCVHGEVLDVVLDLRKGSPTYGKYETFRLSADKGNYLYMPRGVAHGFLATTESATLVYKVSTIYDPARDSGVAWDSFGFDWPVDEPIISSRDRSFLPFGMLNSPFQYE